MLAVGWRGGAQVAALAFGGLAVGHRMRPALMVAAQA